MDASGRLRFWVLRVLKGGAQATSRNGDVTLQPMEATESPDRPYVEPQSPTDKPGGETTGIAEHNRTWSVAHANVDMQTNREVRGMHQDVQDDGRVPGPVEDHRLRGRDGPPQCARDR